MLDRGWWCGYLCRSREGSDPRRREVFHANHISIHAPVKGATFCGPGMVLRARLFQSTLPRRERPSPCSTCTSSAEFQSALPRRERPSMAPRILERKLSSIRAPAKGATFFANPPVTVVSDISIHAPAKGATASCAPSRPSRPHFNPRSREGSDPTVAASYGFAGHFNPRSREGSDVPRAAHGISRPNFNPRSREGSDASSRPTETACG